MCIGLKIPVLMHQRAVSSARKAVRLLLYAFFALWLRKLKMYGFILSRWQLNLVYQWTERQAGLADVTYEWKTVGVFPDWGCTRCVQDEQNFQALGNSTISDGVSKSKANTKTASRFCIARKGKLLHYDAEDSNTTKERQQSTEDGI